MIAAAPLIDGSPYRAYTYSYPHKTAYRHLDQPEPLDVLWKPEARGSLFLYVHVPFCGMRCGFCNLFTKARPAADLVARYLAALRRQAGVVREALGEAGFARCAIGGGTPTYLDATDLETVLDVTKGIMGADLMAIPASVEVSPGTVDAEKLALLVSRGVDRISIGVESFDDAEAAAVLRPQSASTVARALALIRDAGAPTLNIDLIYGLPGQTVDSWLASLRAALRHAPEELYLYPLYVRPLTGLGRTGRAWDDLRLTCYRAGRDLLLGEGYAQHSMRMFRRAGAPDEGGPAYCCQRDGMVGLGCGARSYAGDLHYSSEYAVGAGGVRAILDDYVARPPARFAVADYGYRLDAEDRRRRYVLQSLLTRPGLDLAAYARSFGTLVEDDLPELRELEPLGLAAVEQGTLTLTAAGLERSDAIGPWLYSERARRAMEGYEWH